MISEATKILAVFAHPDDAELLCFGLLKKFADRGADVRVLIASDGSRGVAVGSDPVQDLSQIRMAETSAALATVAASVETLLLCDGALDPGRELVSAIEAVMQRERPDLVVTHYGDKTGTDHNDHAAVALAVRNICYRKHYVKALISCEPLQPFTDFVPSFFVDISEQMSAKSVALSCHASQAGRHYLSEVFHRARGQRWAALAGPERVGAIFEAFRIEKMVID